LHEFHRAAARDMQEDLGWNDLGLEAAADEQPQQSGADIVSIVGDAQTGPGVDQAPGVIHQRPSASANLSALSRPREPSLTPGRRVAFTLRLDADRHLKLRLASTMLNRSAQDIVTEALDHHLAGLAEIEAIAAKIRKGR
jgi:hypothetical protein